MKLSWQERVKEVSKYHVSRLRENLKHTTEETARELNRSHGRTCEDLMLAHWMRTHPRVEKFKNPSQALDYIRTKKREMKLDAGD